MKKIGMSLIAVLLIIGSLNIATAGMVSTDQSLTSAKIIKLGGELDIPMVARDSGLTSILDGAGKANPQDSDTIYTPLIRFNIGFDLGEKITGLVQLENRQLIAGIGTAANGESFGTETINPAIKQAYIKLEKFVVPDLTFTYGLQELKYTLRQGEGAFFLDTGYSSSNVLGNGFTLAGVIKSPSEFGGFHFDYGSLKNSNYQVGVFFGKVQETVAGLDQLHNDTMLNGAIVWFKPNVGDLLVNANLTQFGNSKVGMNVNTVGIGADYPNTVPNLELYGEAYSQSGDAAHKVSQSASATRVGGRYDFPQALKPYVDLSYWMLSGDATVTTKNKNFLSFANVNSTMIMEDTVFGLNVDSNYTAIKVEGGITTKVDLAKDGTYEDLKLKLLIGSFTAVKVPTGISDKMGTEIDLMATLQYNPSVAFSLGYGTVTGAKLYKDAGFKDDSMQMIMFGTSVKF